jgi:hypothetical protein
MTRKRRAVAPTIGRRIFNADEVALIKAGKLPDAKVAWNKRYEQADALERALMESNGATLQ